MSRCKAGQSLNLETGEPEAFMRAESYQTRCWWCCDSVSIWWSMCTKLHRVVFVVWLIVPLVPGLSAISTASTADQHGQGDSMRHPVWPERILRYIADKVCGPLSCFVKIISIVYCKKRSIRCYIYTCSWSMLDPDHIAVFGTRLWHLLWFAARWLLLLVPYEMTRQERKKEWCNGGNMVMTCNDLFRPGVCLKGSCIYMSCCQIVVFKINIATLFFVVTFYHRRGRCWYRIQTGHNFLNPVGGPASMNAYASSGLKSDIGIEHLQVEFACPCCIPLPWCVSLWCPCNGIAMTVLTDGRY